MLTTASPLALPGQNIGILGGSFNPPHAGHRAITTEALKRLQLSKVWWMVSPQNPLKDPSETASLADRLNQAEACSMHPHIEVTAVETGLGTRYTVDTIRLLKQGHPGVRFVWLMGADNLASIHHWQEWRRLFEMVPIAVLDRPDAGLRALASPAARRYEACRIDASDAAGLALCAPPAWCFLHIPLHFENSTSLRRQNSGL